MLLSASGTDASLRARMICCVADWGNVTIWPFLGTSLKELVAAVWASPDEVIHKIARHNVIHIAVMRCNIGFVNWHLLSENQTETCALRLRYSFSSTCRAIASTSSFRPRKATMLCDHANETLNNSGNPTRKTLISWQRFR